MKPIFIGSKLNVRLDSGGISLKELTADLKTRFSQDDISILCAEIELVSVTCL